MGTALGGGNQVDVGLRHDLAALRQPLQRPVNGLIGACKTADKGLLGNAGKIDSGIGEVIGQAVLVIPLLALAFLLVLEPDPQPGTEHRLGAQHMLQARHREIDRVEVLRIRREMHLGSGIALAAAVDDLKVGFLLAATEGHAIHIAIAANGHRQLTGKGIDHRHPYAVQAAAELVVLAGKLAAGVKGGEYDLDPGLALLGVHIHRHAAAVVGHRQRAILVQYDIDLVGVAGQCLIDAVVDHFLGEVVGSGSIGIHARAFAYRLQAGQDFDVLGSVLAHSLGGFSAFNRWGLV